MKTVIADDAVKQRQTAARSVTRVVLATALILLVPLVAMRFTAEVNWTLLDFVAAGVLLIGGGLGLVMSMRKLNTAGSSIAVGVALALALALVWGELAVGIFGTPLGGS